MERVDALLFSDRSPLRRALLDETSRDARVSLLPQIAQDLRKAGLLTADDEAETDAFAKLARRDAAPDMGAALLHAVNASPVFAMAPDLRLRLYLARAALAFFAGLVDEARGEMAAAAAAMRAGAEELETVVAIVAAGEARRPARLLPVLGLIVEQFAIPEFGRALRIGRAAQNLVAALPELVERVEPVGSAMRAFAPESAQGSVPKTRKLFDGNGPSIGEYAKTDRNGVNSDVVKRAFYQPEVDRNFVIVTIAVMFGLSGLFSVVKDFLAISVSPAVDAASANPHDLHPLLFPFWLAAQNALCWVSAMISNGVVCDGANAGAVLTLRNGIVLYLAVGLVAASAGCFYIGYLCDNFVKFFLLMLERMNYREEKDKEKLAEAVINVSEEAELLRIKGEQKNQKISNIINKPNFLRYAPIFVFMIFLYALFAALFIILSVAESFIGIVIATWLAAHLFFSWPLWVEIFVAIIVGLFIAPILSPQRNDDSRSNDRDRGAFVALIAGLRGAFVAALIAGLGAYAATHSALWTGGAASVAFIVLRILNFLRVPSVWLAQSIGSGAVLGLATAPIPTYGRVKNRVLLGLGLSIAMIIIPILLVPLFATLNPRINDVTPSADVAAGARAGAGYFSFAACGDGFEDLEISPRLFLRLGGAPSIEAAPRLAIPDGALAAGTGAAPLVAPGSSESDWGLAKRGSLAPVRPVDIAGGLAVTMAAPSADQNAGGAGGAGPAVKEGLILEPASIAVRLCWPSGADVPVELQALRKVSG